jgi:hypothetical protein
MVILPRFNLLPPVHGELRIRSILSECTRTFSIVRLKHFCGQTVVGMNIPFESIRNVWKR